MPSTSPRNYRVPEPAIEQADPTLVRIRDHGREDAGIDVAGIPPLKPKTRSRLGVGASSNPRTGTDGMASVLEVCIHRLGGKRHGLRCWFARIASSPYNATDGRHA